MVVFFLSTRTYNLVTFVNKNICVCPARRAPGPWPPPPRIREPSTPPPPRALPVAAAAARRGPASALCAARRRRRFAKFPRWDTLRVSHRNTSLLHKKRKKMMSHLLTYMADTHCIVLDSWRGFSLYQL